MKRRRFSTEFKTKVALEAIKGQCTANELAQEFGVYVNQINLGSESRVRGNGRLVPAKDHKIYSYLLRGLEINYSKQVWCSDLTYIIRPKGGFIYLTVVMPAWRQTGTGTVATCCSGKYQ